MTDHDRRWVVLVAPHVISDEGGLTDARPIARFLRSKGPWIALPIVLFALLAWWLIAATSDDSASPFLYELF